MVMKSAIFVWHPGPHTDLKTIFALIQNLAKLCLKMGGVMDE